MTTCIIDFKEGVVYADTQTTNTCKKWERSWAGLLSAEANYGTTTIYETPTTKVHKVSDDLIFSAVGSVEIINKCYMGAVSKDPFPSPSCDDHLGTTILMVTRTGDTTTLVTYEAKVKGVLWKKYYWHVEIVKKHEGYETFGSGKQFAMGALMAGSTPEEAIIAASKVCPYTNATVQSERFNNGLQTN